MPHTEGKRPVTVVSAVMRPDGFADFAVTQVEVTQDEYENGIHIYLAEADLLEAGYDEPFVHFPEDEAPPFLLPAVREHLASARPAPRYAASCTGPARPHAVRPSSTGPAGTI